MQMQTRSIITQKLKCEGGYSQRSSFNAVSIAKSIRLHAVAKCISQVLDFDSCNVSARCELDQNWIKY